MPDIVERVIELNQPEDVLTISDILLSEGFKWLGGETTKEVYESFPNIKRIYVWKGKRMALDTCYHIEDTQHDHNEFTPDTLWQSSGDYMDMELEVDYV